jgi:hypothetical protein
VKIGRPRHLLAAIGRHSDGATAVEFAIVASVFFMMMFVILELGMFLFTRSVMESAITHASRAASIASFPSAAFPSCGDRVCVAQTVVQQKVAGLSNAANISFTMGLLTDGAPFGGDYCQDAGNEHYCTVGNGCPPGTLFTDIGGPPGSPICDPASGGGGAANVNGATIQLQAVYLHRLIIPIPFIRQMFNSPSNDVLPIIVTTVIKNES